MAVNKQKYYVVWKGHKPGIYLSWEACQKQIKAFKGAQYISFDSEEAAKKAFGRNYKDYISKKPKKKSLTREQLLKIGQPNTNSIAVDAAVGGNPGKLEYRGVDVKSGKQIFKQGPFESGTNNVGEFLAIVHGLAWLKKRKSSQILYSDSRTAIGWIKKKHCNTKLERTALNEELFDLIKRAEHWLKINSYSTVIVKWETAAWGEIPADFGRK
ncbi:MAG: ribonuclease H [Flavobacteriaceae bacterium]|nr:ribonuclease H family protein [Bacteroidia bacterium]MBT8288935.1 ribonuclease H family protein [Bacteroidia bacterium]NNF74118.1 ribonuclease H [Flavobacteriaceae bacterium]NNK73664.1 ribonuclease H [Flavobacteriaceae bacterium]